MTIFALVFACSWVLLITKDVVLLLKAQKRQDEFNAGVLWMLEQIATYLDEEAK